jgi:hypothetical protein
MRIRPVVEGYGEVDAVPRLLRRLQSESGAFGLQILSPFRRHASEFLDEQAVRKIVRLSLLRGCEGILILFDSDRRCPLEWAPRITGWARSEARGVPCEVVIAHCEYEAWFLGSLESLRGCQGVRPDVSSIQDPESMRDAKKRLTASMEPGRSYKETELQETLTARFDLAAAYRSCRSFRRMVRAFGILAAGAGVPLTDWPPSSWTAR